jgi:hypothetical protein
VREEGDDVMLDLALDGIDAGGIELCLLSLVADRFGGLLRHDADFGHCVEGMGLDLEPDAVALFRRPDRRHLLPRVARNHAATTIAASRNAEMLSA